MWPCELAWALCRMQKSHLSQISFSFHGRQGPNSSLPPAGLFCSWAVLCVMLVSPGPCVRLTNCVYITCFCVFLCASDDWGGGGNLSFSVYASYNSFPLLPASLQKQISQWPFSLQGLKATWWLVLRPEWQVVASDIHHRYIQPSPEAMCSLCT